MGRSCDDATKARCKEWLLASALAESGACFLWVECAPEWAAALGWAECEVPVVLWILRSGRALSKDRAARGDREE
jgi:hypothetical protein